MAFSDWFRARSFASVPSSSSRAPSLPVLTSCPTASASWLAKRASTSVPPALEVGGDEGVVVQLGIGGVEAIDAGALARAQGLVRIEAFDRGHQPLAPPDLVATRGAGREV